MELKDGTNIIDTLNAVGETNGKQIHANPDELTLIQNHIVKMSQQQPQQRDLRIPVRQIEQMLLSEPYVGMLIGNQCIDFLKQDGVTEMEESIQANTMERRLNDLLLDDYEAKNICVVSRKPIYVSTVSNFTNFLDLFRKTIRSLEVGIPVIVLCRTSNTSQHSYRWTKLLVDLIRDVNDNNKNDNTIPQIDLGMITYISASLPDIQTILQNCQDSTGNLYTTCSRAMAQQITSTYPNTIASTGGPNTLILCTSDTTATKTTTASNTDGGDGENKRNPAKNSRSKFYDAVRTSAAIESSGQCTALRHVFVPSTVPDSELESVLDNIEEITTTGMPSVEALRKGVFAGVFPHHKGTDAPSSVDNYTKSSTVDAYFKINDSIDSVNNVNSPMHEYWRKVVVDFTKIDLKDSKSAIQEIAGWLRKNQPISVAVNGKRLESMIFGVKLWEQSSQVVFTVGSIDSVDTMPPALTCQARPQDGEIFGEFPTRNDMKQYTKFPVIVPSSNPSYDTHYTMEYLELLNTHMDTSIYLKDIQGLLNDDTMVQNVPVRGYCIEIIEYLRNVCRMNPKDVTGTERTSMYGLQRPPLGTKSILICGPNTSLCDVMPIMCIFLATTARDQLVITIDPSNQNGLEALCKKYKLKYSMESESNMLQKKKGNDDSDTVFHYIEVENRNNHTEFPLVGQFVSLYLPLGHIKGTMANDQEFMLRASMSNKWLNSLF